MIFFPPPGHFVLSKSLYLLFYYIFLIVSVWDYIPLEEEDPSPFTDSSVTLAFICWFILRTSEGKVKTIGKVLWGT